MTEDQIDTAALALARYDAESAGYPLHPAVAVDDLEGAERYRQMAAIVFNTLGQNE